MTLVNIVLANGLILAERDLSFLILLLGVLDANGERWSDQLPICPA